MVYQRGCVWCHRFINYIFFFYLALSTFACGTLGRRRALNFAKLAETFVEQGIEEFEAGRFESAIIYWNKAIKLKPQDSEVHNFLGIAYHRQGNLKKAEYHFKKAVEINPNFYEAYNNLGYILFLQKEYPHALAAFGEALKINPDYQQAKDNLYITAKILGGEMKLEAFQLFQDSDRIENLEEKIRNYQKVIAIDSAYVEAYNNLAVAFYFAEKVDSAIIFLKKALSRNPTYPEAYNNLGYIYDELGQHEKAIELFHKAVELKPDYIIAYNNMAVTYYRMGQFSNAKKIWKKVLELDPDNETASIWLRRVRN